MTNNEIYLLIKYIKSVLSRVAKLLCYIEDARCLKVKAGYKLLTEIFPSVTCWPTPVFSPFRPNHSNSVLCLNIQTVVKFQSCVRVYETLPFVHK